MSHRVRSWAALRPGPSRTLPVTGDRSLRGKVAVVGIGESAYYRYGQSPYSEFELLLQAILAACEDAGISPREIDGYSTYAADRGLPTRIHTALGCDDIRLSNMQWGSGGGGTAASIGNAAAAIAAGTADCVVAYRGIAQGQYGRFGAGGGQPDGVGHDEVHAAVRADVGGAALRHAGEPALRDPRHQSRHAEGGLAGELPPRAAEPPGDHAGPAAHPARPTTSPAGSSSRSGSSTAASRTTAPPRSCWCRPSAPRTSPIGRSTSSGRSREAATGPTPQPTTTPTTPPAGTRPPRPGSSPRPA